MSLSGRVRSPLFPERFKTTNAEEKIWLTAPVGARRKNRAPDVVTIEKSLGAVGFLAPQRASRPTGLFDNELESALRTYQGAAQLKTDGLINPGGPTIAALQNRSAANMITSRRVSAEAESATNRMLRAMGRTRDKTEIGKLLANTAINYGDAGQAEVSHLIHQSARKNPEESADLQESLAHVLPQNLHRALYARAVSRIEDDRNEKLSSRRKSAKNSRCVAEFLDSMKATAAFKAARRKLTSLKKVVEQKKIDLIIHEADIEFGEAVIKVSKFGAT